MLCLRSPVETTSDKREGSAIRLSYLEDACPLVRTASTQDGESKNVKSIHDGYTEFERRCGDSKDMQTEILICRISDTCVTPAKVAR